MRIVLAGIFVCLGSWLFAGPPSTIKFIENKRQWDAAVHYTALIPGGEIEIRGGQFVYYFLDHARIDDLHHRRHSGKAKPNETGEQLVDGVKVNVEFVGANNSSRPTGIGRSEEYYNFFIGTDSSKWASEVYGYDGFVYPSLYHGIDLKMYVKGEDLKYDMIVAPGFDASVIRLRYNGMDRITLNEGDVIVETRFVQILEKRPYAYQIINGKQVSVPCEYVLVGNELSFVFPEGYDACYELVIDPQLIFSTYNGSKADSWGSTATPAEHGMMYSSGILNHFVGTQLSGTFPATAGSFQTSYGGLWDVGILKYDSAGKQLLYASYLGGSDSEFSHSLVVNKNNELIVMGTTSSTNFPTTFGAHQRSLADVGQGPLSHVITYNFGSDLFIARISRDGKQLLRSTYLGGSNIDGLNTNESVLVKNYGDELRGDVITDDEGNIYISSVTKSSDLPALNSYLGGTSDAIIVKMNKELTDVLWLRYLGGSGADAAHTIKLDNEQNIYTAGGTSSVNFPIIGGAYQNTYSGEVDGWIAKVSNNGETILKSTFSGSAEFDQIYFLDLNLDEEVYVYGQTNGNRPVSSPDLYSNPNSGQFIQKFNNDLSAQIFYTVFGSGKGSPDISPTAFLVNECNYLYMGGWGGELNTTNKGDAFETTTTALATSADAWQSTTAGHDFYFIVLSSDAKERLYATFLGGTNSWTHVDGGTSRFDKRGIAYHAVCAGCGGGQDDFPTTQGAFSRTNNSLNCNNAAFKFDLSSLRAVLRLRGEDKVCIPGKFEIENFSIGGEVYIWDFGDNTPELVLKDKRSVEHEYKEPGTYTVWLKTIDSGTCKVRDSTSVKVHVFEQNSSFPEDATICEGTSHELVANGGVSYHWYSKDGKYDITTPSNTLNVSPTDSTLFYIAVTEGSGCSVLDSTWVHVIPKLTPEFLVERDADCTEAIPILKVTNQTDSLWASDTFLFDFGDGTTSDLDEIEHHFEKEGSYNVKLIAAREFCVSETTLPLVFGPIKIPNVITPVSAEGFNDRFFIQFGADKNKSPIDYGFATEVQIYDRWGRLVYENKDYKNDWAGSDVTGGVYYFEVTVDQHATCKGWVHVLK